MNQVTYIGILAVETRHLMTAIEAEARIMKRLPHAVRGAVMVNGKRVRWSTIQQYEQHGGFCVRREAL